MTDLPIKNQTLLQTALTHRSFLNENSAIAEHNERLEFLGDAVLELVVSEFLFQKFPGKPEGELTAYRAALVRTTTLAEIAVEIGLGDKLQLSKGEELSGGRKNKSLLANTFEAVIGAIYLDSGYNTAMSFLTDTLLPRLDTIISEKLFKYYKSTLQELVQAQGKSSPEYEVLEESGPDHNKHFIIGVKVAGTVVATGEGRSKQEAQQEAARKALENINEG